MSLEKNLSDPLEGCMLFRDEVDEPLEKLSIKKRKVDPLEGHKFSVEQALADPWEECMLFRDENDEPLDRFYLNNKTVDTFDKSFLLDKSNEQLMEISTVKKEPVDVLEDDYQLIVDKTYEFCRKKITIVKKEPVDLLEEECQLNTDKTGEIFQENSIIKRRKPNHTKEEYHLITDKGDNHPLEVIIKNEPIDILEDEYQLVLDKNNDFPHEITIIKKECDDLNVGKCCSITDQNNEVSSDTLFTKKELDDTQSFSVKNESLVPFEECLLMDNAQQYFLQGGSEMKQELIDPFEECLLDMDKTNDKLNCVSVTSLMKEESVDPFKKCESSENHYTVEHLDILSKPYIRVKSPNQLFAAIKLDSKEETKRSLLQTRKQLPSFQGPVSPIITIRHKKDIQVSEDKKLQHKKFDCALFYDPPERIDESKDDSLSCTPKKILPKINMKHSCKTAVLCPECNHSFANPTFLKTHLLYNHGLRDVPRYYCCKCKELFQDIYDLMNHMTKESGQILVYCCFCNGSFVIRKHADNFLYRTSFYVKRERCKMCLKVFSTVEFLKRHVCAVASVVGSKY